MTRGHHCHALNCNHITPPSMFICNYHWSMVPRELKKAIWTYYRPGQEQDKRPSPAYLTAAQAAILAVAEAERLDTGDSSTGDSSTGDSSTGDSSTGDT